MAKQREPKWRNRIVAHGEADPESLLANPRNWRIHPQAQQDAVENVLDDVGWVDTILVNQRTGFVVDGHLRVRLALRQHEQSIPVTYLDLNEEEEMEVLASLDPLSAMAVSDTEKINELAELLRPTRPGAVSLLEGLQQAYTPHSGEALMRPDFKGVVEHLGASPTNPMANAGDGNWFYIEFYGDDDQYAGLVDLLRPAMKGASKHEIEASFFAQMVRDYLTAKPRSKK